MAANPTPNDDAVLKAPAEDMSDGCHDHEATISIKQNTEAAIRATIIAFDTAKMGRGTAEQLLSQRFDVPQAANAGEVTHAALAAVIDGTQARTATPWRSLI